MCNGMYYYVMSFVNELFIDKRFMVKRLFYSYCTRNTIMFVCIQAVNVALLSCESFDKVKQIIVEAKSMLGEILSGMFMTMNYKMVKCLLQLLNLWMVRQWSW